GVRAAAGKDAALSCDACRRARPPPRGRPEEAIRVLQAALAADSSHQEARRMLIECYLHSGQTEAALEEIDALLGYHAMAGQQPAALGPGRTSPAFATRSA